MDKKYTLKELRACKNMTQADVAKRLGISAQTYCAWENDFGIVKRKKELYRKLKITA